MGANEYSKMTSVEIYNFMPYKHEKAIFDETGMLNLKGFNSTGKTAFNTAIAVCLMNLYTSKQGCFIRHDEDYFRIIVSFDDGVSIVRDKYSNGQSLYEMYREQECIFTTKQGNKLSKISGVPAPIKAYLDLVETDLGYLNFQTRQDPLWLIDTKGSENYSALNEVLKTEEISRANTMLNSDVNALNSEIATIEADLQRKELQLDACEGVTEGLISSLKEKEVKVTQIMGMHSKVRRVNSLYDDLSKLVEVPEVSKIPVAQKKAIGSIQGIYSEYTSLKEIPPMDKIDSDKLRYLTILTSTLKGLASTSKEIPEVERITTLSQRTKISAVLKEFRELEKVEENLTEVGNLESKLNKEKEEFLKRAEEQGVFFVTCDNCGTLMEVSKNGT